MKIALALGVALAASRAHALAPAVEYALNCQGCHRADGAGTAGSVPPLRGAVAKFLLAPGGREYLAQVPGVAQAPLDDRALADVLNWMLDHFDKEHVPAGFAAYTAEEMGRLRRTPLVDVEGVRRRLLDVVEGRR